MVAERPEKLALLWLGDIPQKIAQAKAKTFLAIQGYSYDIYLMKTLIILKEARDLKGFRNWVKNTRLQGPVLFL